MYCYKQQDVLVASVDQVDLRDADVDIMGEAEELGAELVAQPRCGFLCVRVACLVLLWLCTYHRHTYLHFSMCECHCLGAMLSFTG